MANNSVNTNALLDFLGIGEWVKDAACGGMDPNLFFPGDSKNYPHKDKALKICRGCPVRAQCFEAGTGQNGIWGGTTPWQRPNKHSRRAS